jgi:hypothetical protein
MVASVRRGGWLVVACAARAAFAAVAQSRPTATIVFEADLSGARIELAN